MQASVPTKETINQAHERIIPFIHQTPIFTSSLINEISECDIYFKCENLQKVGAFKARGGFNAILSLPANKKANGVCTHSSGNHAQAVAKAAQTTGIKAYIVMPKTAPKVKKAAVLGYDAEVIECGPTLEAREEGVRQVVTKTGAEIIHPYNDYRIIAGQATAAKEIYEGANNEMDYLLTPVGGGGLLSGSALATHYFSNKTKIIGCEPEGADDAYRSLTSGKLAPQTNPNTIADGLLTSLGDKNFEIIKKYVQHILLANDEEIVKAMRLIWERLKLIVEPSAAVPLAALLRNKPIFKGKKVAVILTGGNVDLANLPFSARDR